MDAHFWYPLPGQAFVEVRGRDARDFLNRITTNAVKKMQPGDVLHNLLLGGDGRLVAETHTVCKGTEDFLLVAAAGLREALLEQLDRFLFAEQVEIRDMSDEVRSARVISDAVSGLINGTLLQHFVHPKADASSMAATVWSTEGDTAYRHLQEILGAPADEEKYELVRIQLGEPAWGKDLSGTTIPLEAGLKDAIDFTKGCFPGQEIVARIENLGHPANMLVGLRIAAEQVAEGAPIFVGEKQVGRVTSVARLGDAAAGSDAALVSLGYVKWDFRTAGTRLQTKVAGEADITVVDLPMLTGNATV